MTSDVLKQIYDPPSKCPILYAMKIIGSKWKMPIIWQLMMEDGLHYNELRRRVKGITNTMLTRCLRELEDNKLIYRYSYETIPPSVTYYLTDIGKELSPALEGLFDWGNRHMEHFDQEK